jgi:hypothetical protein
MTGSMAMDLFAIVLLVLAGFAVIDMWRDGHKWAAIFLVTALWVIALIVILLAWPVSQV